jgi:lysophospholipase L1-like esterase
MKIGNAIGIPFRRHSGGAAAAAIIDGVPSNLTLTVVNDVQINLSWTIGSTNQDGHSIERSLTGINGWSEIATVLGATATYNNTGLTQATQYFYRVRAYVGTDYSSYTNIAFKTTMANALSDGNTKLWVVAKDTTRRTIDSLSRLSQWNDQLDSGRNLVQATDVNKPVWMGQGVRFNGSTSIMTCAFINNQPVTIYFVAKPLLWAVGNMLSSGGGLNLVTFRQSTPPGTPYAQFYSGTWGGGTNEFTLLAWHNISIIFYGANSHVKVDGNADSGAINLGTTNGTGFNLCGQTSSGYMQALVREVIVRSAADSDATRLNIYNYLNLKYTALYSLSFLGDSIIGQYSSGWYPANQFLSGVYNMTEYQYQGETIAQQKARWVAGHTGTEDCTFILCGHNDINAGAAASTVIASLQDLVDTVRADVGASRKIVISTLAPVKIAYGAVKWARIVDVNEAIKGNGATPITGVDAVTYSHTADLSDGNGNYLPAYDSGDGLHENNGGRAIIAAAWRVALDTLLL